MFLKLDYKLETSHIFNLLTTKFYAKKNKFGGAHFSPELSATRFASLLKKNKVVETENSRREEKF